MREIVVISGKGGTGKTSITAALATFFKGECVVADCDVDAADMHLLFEPNIVTQEPFMSGLEARIEPLFCRYCGKCMAYCRFHAIEYVEERYWVNPISCEGCGYCAKICSTNAIEMLPKQAGEWYVSRIRGEEWMVHARLGVGAENSGKLVAKVKKEAKRVAEEQSKSWIVVDGSPGIGCPVVSSLSGASAVLLVTEPTVSGVHDLKRVYEVVKRFSLKAFCLINKADLNAAVAEEILAYLDKEGITLIASIPYTPSVVEAMVAKQSLLEYNDVALQEALRAGFGLLKEQMEQNV